MKRQFFLAAAIVCASGVAQATTSFGSYLNNGVNTIDISLPKVSPGGLFQEDVTFSLRATSNVIGSLSGVTGDVTLIEVTAQRFSEQGTSPVISVTPTEVGDLSTFNLGQLWAPTNMGFETGLYTLSLSGIKAAGVSSLRLSLNVSSVPEPTVWAMFALGLAGLAGTHRAKKWNGRRPD